MAKTKFQPTTTDEVVVALAATIAASKSLTKASDSFNLSDRTLAAGDTVTIAAGLPVCKQGEIAGENHEWLAFPATIIRGARRISTTIALNSLVRGYYALEEDKVLSTSKKGTMYPSQELIPRFGTVTIDSIVTQNGAQVPFLSEDYSLKIVKVEGYRPVFNNGVWNTGDKEDLFVVK